jgi:hypothetical protein
MASPGVLSIPVARGGARTGGVRLSGLTFGVYPGRRHQEFLPHHAAIGLDVMKAYGLSPEEEVLKSWRGHSFTAVTGDLLDALPEPLPELDLVMTAFATPDLYVCETAGCYLADRCSGEPDSFGISEQGAGAAFTALRIADSMLRFGALRDGALFVLDQSSPIHDAGTDPGAYVDAGALVRFGRAGEVEVAFVGDVETDDPAAELAALRVDLPGTRAVIGTALAPLLPGEIENVVAAPAGFATTSVWIALAGLWPLAEPVLLADYDPYAGRLYTCHLNPVEQS